MLVLSHQSLFHIDILAYTMIGLIILIGAVVCIFSKRYMQGDKLYYPFFVRVILLMASVSVTAAADNIWLLLISWLTSNILLIQLMIHKASWKPAYCSGLLTAKTFAIGFICLLSAFILLYVQTGEESIQQIISYHQYRMDNIQTVSILLLILIAAMTQSAIWPFHKWLISSLNSPTPVSAIMHAGLVNGGGFLLARFALLFHMNATILNLIFILGLISACFGTIWKLMQHDVKRMLASSTMGQMGYMLMQCGLGFFPAAIIHLCCHGMFKANLFLASGGAGGERRIRYAEQVTLPRFFISVSSGFISSYVFSVGMHTPWLSQNSSLFFIILTIFIASQFTLSMILNLKWYQCAYAILIAALLSYLYGYSIYLTEIMFEPMQILKPQPFNYFHFTSLVILGSLWLMVLFKDHYESRNGLRLWAVLYMKLLNSSQPHPLTVTSIRNQYQYK